MIVDYIFDFVSPNAYLVHKLLPGISDRTGAEFNYIPCLLGGIFKQTGNQAPWQAFSHVPSKVGYEELELKRFLVKHRISDFNMNTFFPINSIALMRGACAMQLKGADAFDQYLEIMFAAMWEDSKNMGDPVEVAKVLAAAGYDPQLFMGLIQRDQVKGLLKANTAKAITRGAFGVPTFFVGDEIFFGKERLQQVEEEIVRQQA
ncbi:MAG: 2-hydroxychromene-2-carboxylate isomerase [Arenicella sp.]|jgi:2-hydroxychromene-2-carboxylate isomerase